MFTASKVFFFIIPVWYCFLFLRLHEDSLRRRRETHAGVGRDDGVRGGVIVVRLLVQARRALAPVEHVALHEVALSVGVIHIPRG